MEVMLALIIGKRTTAVVGVGVRVEFSVSVSISVSFSRESLCHRINSLFCF